jgi:hypothetical protein
LASGTCAPAKVRSGGLDYEGSAESPKGIKTEGKVWGLSSRELS